METTEKEALAEKALKVNKIFDVFFPGNIGYKKITVKKLQLAGVDYEVYFPDDKVEYVDLKTGIGPDYSMKQEDYTSPHRIIGRQPALALEVYQYGQFTNTKSKMTDYFIYYLKDDYQEAFYLVPYIDVRNVCLKHKKTFKIENGIAKEVFNGEYTVHKSFNGTGDYIKVPASSVAVKEQKIFSQNIEL